MLVAVHVTVVFPSEKVEGELGKHETVSGTTSEVVGVYPRLAEGALFIGCNI